MRLRDGRLRVVGVGEAMREGSTSLGALRRALAAAEDAGARSINAMVHAVHALRGVVASVTVAVPKSWRRSDLAGNITDDAYGARLERLGRLVVELPERLSPERDPDAGRAVGLAS